MTKNLDVLAVLLVKNKAVHIFYPAAFFGHRSYNFSCLGLTKVQLPTICPINRNAHAPQAIRSYINNLLQAGYQKCAPQTMIKESADSILSVQNYLPVAFVANQNLIS